MPGVPSNKACEQCKKRHLKCDETRPSCRRCVNAGIECPGYAQTRKFIDQGATVRRRYAPYRESSRARTQSPKNYGAQQSREAQVVAQDATPVNRSLRTITPQSEGPHEEQEHGSDVAQQMRGTPHGTPEITHVTVQQAGSLSTQPAQFDEHSLLNAGYPAGFEQHRNTSDSVQSPVPYAGDSIESDTMYSSLDQRHGLDTIFSNENGQEGVDGIFSELMTGSEHEIAFLTRHFSETLGPWLDLSDSTKFFSVYTPIRAINNNFLKYAIAALAAKHLGRLNGQKASSASGMFTSPATMETYPNSKRVDWIFKGENYYVVAIVRMREVISDGYSSVSSSAMLESPIETVSRWLSLQSTQDELMRAEGSDVDGISRKIESLLTACVILTAYKLLDVPGEEWQLHLVGIDILFDYLLRLYTSANISRFSRGARAAFWNFARQDYLAAYYNRAPTHLKQDNLPLWLAAGIPTHDQPDNTPFTSQEDLSSTKLIHLMNKVVNFLADYKLSQIAQWTDLSESPQQTQQPTTSTWLNLCFGFQTWLESVPETFRPSLRIEHPRDMSNLAETRTLPFPEVFYSLPSCAAAMQHYHFGRMALLLNRPPDVVSAPGSAFDRLASLREVTKEVDYRCREVCGIALSRPRGEVRVYMVPLLFAVGQCLETDETRRVIVDLLWGVEKDLGVVTAGTVEKLQEAWRQP